MPSLETSPWATSRRHDTAVAVLKALRPGEDQLIIERYFVERYGSRRATVILTMLARQIEIAPWKKGDLA